jgi:cytochrome c553
MKYNSKTKIVLIAATLLSLLALSSLSHAADKSASCPAPHHHHKGHVMGYGEMDIGSSGIAPGEKIAEAVCSACHGKNGISISDDIPNLAGQESVYLCESLAAYRIKARNAPIMNDVAGKLSDQDIIDLSEYYAHLPAQKH